jgi:hypothetical protein
MVITVALQLGRGLQPVKVPTEPLDGVKLADNGQPSLVCAAFRACGYKWCCLSVASRGSEGGIWSRLALRIMIECPSSAVSTMSQKGCVRDYADDNLSPGVLQGVLAAGCRWSSLFGGCLLARLDLRRYYRASLCRHRGRRGR